MAVQALDGLFPGILGHHASLMYLWLKNCIVLERTIRAVMGKRGRTLSSPTVVARHLNLQAWMSHDTGERGTTVLLHRK